MSENTALGAPSSTLYVNNINEKVKLDVLKRQFNMLFSQYGKVSSITAYSTLKTKGQAWILFENEKAATAAMKAKQGFNFYDQPLKIQYARGTPKDRNDKGSSRTGIKVKREELEGEQDAKRARV
jgi:RNA recognition motif-containing protein